jgi:L-asparagine oxygenase
MTEIKIQLELNGYAFIPSDSIAEETLTSISNLGIVIQINKTNQTQILTPDRSSNSNLNTYSGNFGLLAYPLHTDLAHWRLPPRYFTLRCITGSEDVSTYLINTKELISVIGHNILQRALVTPRRPVDGSYYIVRLLETIKNNNDLFRWDSLFLKPVNEYCKDVLKDVQQYLMTVNKQCLFLINRGDTLIVDNWKMLHGRSAINKNALNRKIERVYLREVF